MNEFLYTIEYSSLDLWDVKRYSRVTFTSHYSIEPLGRHINSETQKIKLYEFPKDNFSILGISNEIGMYDAYDKKGEEFNQSYKVVKDGFIAYNPYRINVGSIGIKTPHLKGNLISPAYVVFSCKETILPEFLFLLMKTKKFNEQVKENTSGSVRQNLTYDALATIKIPIPPIPVQIEIIETYYTMIRKAKSIVKTSWVKMDQHYIDSLKAKNYQYNPLSEYMFGFVDFRKLTRWDSWVSDTGLVSEKYDVVPFGELVIGSPQYGANVKGVDTPCDYRYVRITDINDDGCLNEDIKYPETIEKDYILHENDFLIARSGNTVGKTFLYKSEIGPAIFAGYLVRYILNQEVVLPEYLLFYTKTAIFKSWIIKNQRVAGQPNINGQEYLSFPVVLPPLEKQYEIVSSAKKIADQIKLEQNQSYLMLEQAKQDFEDAVFSQEG